MAISTKGNALLSRLKALTRLQRFSHSLVEGELQPRTYQEMNAHVDTTKWKKVDSRTFGLTRSMISNPSWIVLKILKNEGFEAYLVGGCVRDLLLNKIPKDFDVITTASLIQIKKQFHRAQIVGRRFPICRVHVKGSVIEVSSFDTVAGHAKKKEKVNFTQIPSGCDKNDFVRWRDCMHRDFTINSLFFDPFMNKIYDYANGMMDLKSLKLQTLIPAQLSFTEDCARILRGLRIAARLGLSFSKDTETAIHKLSLSIMSLDKSRIMMELNYMLSYGAAEPSLYLLQRFNLLELLLPFHAAYLAQQSSNQIASRSMMLMKLFFSLDNLVTCDRPTDCSMWVGLLAFHLALVNNPQDALVVWSFSSVLYHGGWKEGVKFARAHARANVNFVPEVLGACDFRSDKELAKEVTQLAVLVQDSIDALTEADCLIESMSRYPFSPCSGLVFIPKKTGKDVAKIFSELIREIEFYEEGRESFGIDYDLLGKGNPSEIRHVLGKAIIDTMTGGVAQVGRGVVEVQNDCQKTVDSEVQPAVTEDNCCAMLSDLVKKSMGAKDSRVIANKKQGVTVNEKCQETTVDHKKGANKKNAGEMGQLLEEASVTQFLGSGKEKYHLLRLRGKRSKRHCEIVEKEKCHKSQDEVTKKQKVVEKCHLLQEETKDQGRMGAFRRWKRLPKKGRKEKELSSLFR
ncbi:uncharacterized protein LOC131166879 isoform X2 [Malania oleifera]|uniref:uncharacterized protein LOC131166879 isoform X2 n=1 Tax=Malania oleifera TaxID=397392 RepID=UPI0025AE263E|nr:uncharacterized protein LOC131166879 isoform X2 [Malania oleifera]